MINIIYTVLCIACLCIGFYFGYRLPKQEKMIKEIHPIKTVKQKMESIAINKEIKEQIEEINKINRNIERYDGTSKGQEEVKNVEITLL